MPVGNFDTECHPSSFCSTVLALEPSGILVGVSWVYDQLSEMDVVDSMVIRRDVCDEGHVVVWRGDLLHGRRDLVYIYM